MGNSDHLTLVPGNADPNRGSEKWASKVRKDAKGLAGQLDEGYIELARLLYDIYDTPIDGDPKNPPIYTQWGYTSFNDYVEDELGIHRKRAQRLRSVWFHLEVRLKDRLDTKTKNRLIAVGFSKVRELASIITPKNAEKWIEKAEELSYPKLCTVIQKYSADAERRTEVRQLEEEFNGSSPSATTQTAGSEAKSSADSDFDEEPAVPEYNGDDLKPLRFSVYPEQKEIIEQALERAGQLSGSDIKSNNLHLICMDFLASNDFGKATAKQKLRFLAKLEVGLGLKLVAFDGADVVYGITTLQAVAGEDK